MKDVYVCGESGCGLFENTLLRKLQINLNQDSWYLAEIWTRNLLDINQKDYHLNQLVHWIEFWSS